MNRTTPLDIYLVGVIIMDQSLMDRSGLSLVRLKCPFKKRLLLEYLDCAASMIEQEASPKFIGRLKCRPSMLLQSAITHGCLHLGRLMFMALSIRLGWSVFGNISVRKINQCDTGPVVLQRTRSSPRSNGYDSIQQSN
jgi:hypothetical protein